MGERKRMTEKQIRQQAYDTVVRVRGSDDVPAFDLCVESEIRNIKARLARPTTHKGER